MHPLDGFVIAVSSNENRVKGLSYKFHGYPVLSQHLETGDYSVVGYEDRITVERKTQSDFYGSVGKGKARFIKELIRMQAFEYAEIVVECTYEQLLDGCIKKGESREKALWSNNRCGFYRDSMKGIVAEIRYKYKIPIMFAGNRKLGEEWTLQVLSKWYKHNRKEE